MNWSAGYVTEIDYTLGYFREQSPVHLRMACIGAGVVPPDYDRLSYLELGFGQGVTLNIHASTVTGDFWGNDFNPAQTARARALASASGSGVKLLEDSFEELAARPNLPEFDMITLHGIWSWISPENRHFIIDIIRRKLRPGGILYISYNTSPGWQAAAPFQQLLKMHARFAGTETTGIAAKAKNALDFAAKLREVGALYFKNVPEAGARLDEMLTKDMTYVAHEFFNEHWTPMAFTEVARDLEQAKLDFVSSAILREQISGFALSEAARDLLAGIENPVFNQYIRDFLFNRRFRRDIFVKGARALTASERLELLLTQHIALVQHPDEMQPNIPGAKASVREPPFQTVIDALMEDKFRPKTIGELASHPKLLSAGPTAVFNTIRMLNGPGYVSAAQQPSKDVQRFSSGFNMHVYKAAQHKGDMKFVASPVIGGGIFIPQSQQLFLLATKQGIKDPAEQAKFVMRAPAFHNTRLTREGKRLESAEENLAEWTRRAAEFGNKRLPMLSALGLI